MPFRFIFASILQLGRGVVFRIADDHDFAAVRPHDLGLGDGVGGVVGAFALEVGLEGPEEARGGVFVEDRDVGDAADAEMISARSPCGITGRPSPLSWRTESSPFTPTTRTSATPAASWR